jgi:hypothetical protein
LGLWLGDSAGLLDRIQPALRLEVFDRQTRAWGPRFDPRYDGMVYCEYQVTAVENEPEDGLLGSTDRQSAVDLSDA